MCQELLYGPGESSEQGFSHRASSLFFFCTDIQTRSGPFASSAVFCLCSRNTFILGRYGLDNALLCVVSLANPFQPLLSQGYSAGHSRVGPQR